MKNNKRNIFILGLGLAIVLSGGGLLYTVLPGYLEQREELRNQNPELTVTETAPSRPEDPALVPAPDFTVYNAQGESVRFFDLSGQPVVINFWASWCIYCKQEMPDFEQVYQDWGGEMCFMMINATDTRETKEVADAYLESQDFTFPVYYDSEQQAISAYGPRGLPATVFIGADGKLVAAREGLITKEELVRGIEALLPGSSEQ